MTRIIDFDSPSSFPEELGVWDADFENYIRHSIEQKSTFTPHALKNQLLDLHTDEMPIVTDYLKSHVTAEVAVCHCSRIMDIGKLRAEGLNTGGGRRAAADARLRDLLAQIGLKSDDTEKVMSKVYYYWDRDKEQRTASVHFFFDKNLVYRDDQTNAFALNLGGEILRWAIEGCGNSLYKTEPYKRLWILGAPCIVKFKCRLENIHPMKRAPLVAEIVNYYISTKLFHCPYEFAFTGMTTGPVPSEDIISIEEITGFIEMQEKYEEYTGFYDELK